MKIHKRSGLIHLLILIAFTLPICRASAAERDYLVLSHGLTKAPAKYAARAIDVTEARIKAWDQAFVKKGIGVRRLLSAPYGSGFLAFNRKGMDFDYLCVLDLGILRQTSSRDQAEEIVEKITRALLTVREVNEGIPDRASLYVYYPGPFGRSGWVKGREETLSLVADRLEAIKEGRPARAAFRDRNGNIVPAALFPFQVVIPLNMKVRMASNVVTYYPGMFAGLRTISVQFFFSAGLQKDGQVQHLNICPLFTRSGAVIPFFELMVNNVFLSQDEAELYAERIRHLPERRVILYNARRLFLISGYEHGEGRYLKQLKRMHQCYNSLFWAFGARERETMEKDLKRWLHSDWAVLVADLIEQGDMWQEGGYLMRQTFVRAGDLHKLAAFLSRVRGRLGPDPRLASELGELEMLAARFARGRAAKGDFVKLEDIGRRIGAKTGPSKNELARLLSVFSRKFDEMGFKKVNIFGVRNGRLSLWRDELFAAGLDPARVNMGPRQGGVKKLGGFDFEVLDRLAPGQAPLRPLLFRVVFSGEPAKRFERYYKAISWP